MYCWLITREKTELEMFNFWRKMMKKILHPALSYIDKYNKESIVCLSVLLEKIWQMCVCVCAIYALHILPVHKIAKNVDFTRVWNTASSFGIATDYDLYDVGIESLWGQNFPHLSRPALNPTQPPIQWVPVLSRGKMRPERGADHHQHIWQRFM